MTRTALAALLALAVMPLAAAQERDATERKTQDITLRGCVTPAEDDDQYVLTNVTEVPPASGSTIPAQAHGRKVVFWLDDDDEIAKHANKGVEVRGTIEGYEESEIELNAGRAEDGGLLVEFEGPGDDVQIARSRVEGAVGTSGSNQPRASDNDADEDEIKTMLVKVDVQSVASAEYACLDQK